MADGDRSRKRKGYVRLFVHAQECAVEDMIGIGIAVKNHSGRIIDWHAERRSIEPGVSPQLSAIEQALKVALKRRAKNVTVLIDDAMAVRQANRESDVPAESVTTYMRLRALLNQLPKAAIRYVCPEQNLEAQHLAKAAAVNERVGILTRNKMPSLFSIKDTAEREMF